MKLVPATDEHADELFGKYSLLGFPTLLFLDAAGNELDRLGDFLPPEQFLSELARIQSGDTFASRVERLAQNPTDLDLLNLVLEGHRLRGDFPAAYASLDAFQANYSGPEPDPSLPLQLETLMTGHRLLYSRAAREFNNGWQKMSDVSGTRSSPALKALLATAISELDQDQQARELRNAKHSDAGTLLAMLPAEEMDAPLLLASARFAAQSGHYETAAGYYRSWYETNGATADPGTLNAIAWDLYLCRRDIELAIDIAKAAYGLDNAHHVADTLARLLYVNGAVDEAIELQTKAAAEANDEGYAATLTAMKLGEQLGDQPRFEHYPL